LRIDDEMVADVLGGALAADKDKHKDRLYDTLASLDSPLHMENIDSNFTDRRTDDRRTDDRVASTARSVKGGHGAEGEERGEREVKEKLDSGKDDHDRHSKDDDAYQSLLQRTAEHVRPYALMKSLF
jgi:hypothetical protein